jgi:hypothetical protein
MSKILSNRGLGSTSHRWVIQQSAAKQYRLHSVPRHCADTAADPRAFARPLLSQRQLYDLSCTHSVTVTYRNAKGGSDGQFL